MKIIDLSLTLNNNCMSCNAPWHTKVSISSLGKINEVGRNTSKIILGSHSGTHIDAPKHFFNEGYSINDIPMEKLCGNVSIIDLSYKTQGDRVTLEDINKITVTEKMLFYFNWDKNWLTNKYYDRFPYFTYEAAQYLLDNGIQLIGLDTPSPDSATNIQTIGEKDSPIHKLFLKNQIVIIEYLTNISCINKTKKLTLVALPLKLAETDGSPARVIVMEEE